MYLSIHVSNFRKLIYNQKELECENKTDENIVMFYVHEVPYRLN